SCRHRQGKLFSQCRRLLDAIKERPAPAGSAIFSGGVAQITPRCAADPIDMAQSAEERAAVATENDGFLRCNMSDRRLFVSSGKLLLYRRSETREAQEHCGYCQ